MKELEIKKTLNMKRLMMAVALTACVFSHAFAATPKTESTVVSDSITLGDVFDGITDHADFYLAPAPATGKTKILNTNDLVRISDAFNLGWTPASNLEQVVIRRSSNIIDHYDIQAALQKSMSEKLKGQKFEMDLSDHSASFHIADPEDKAVNVENLTFDAAKGEFKALVAAAAAPDVKKEVKGKFYPISQLPVLKSPLRQGDIISAADIDYVDIRSTDITASMVVDAKKLIGQTPRRGIAAMKPIGTLDVQWPTIVKKGDLVTMVLNSSVLNLTAQGRAMDNGSEGDAVRVMNTTSKQIVGAVVTGPETVTIKAPTDTM